MTETLIVNEDKKYQEIEIDKSEWLSTKQFSLLRKENGKFLDGGEGFRKMLEELSTDEIMEEMTRCADSFQYFCENYVWITHPKRGLILFELYGYQNRCIHDYDHHKHNIIRKFRQGGLTTLTVIWALWRCMFKNDQKIMVLSKSDREAKGAGKTASNVIKYLPSWMMPEIELDNQHEKVFSDTNGTLEFWTCEAARSKSLTYLIIDEAAFIKNMDEHWKSMYPTLSTGGSCIVISTVNGLGNWYEEWFHAAQQGKNMFHVIDIEYKENPEYCNDNWVKEMKANLGERGWRQEVLGDFLGSGETYVNGEVIAELAKMAGRTPPIDKMYAEHENDDTGSHDEWKMLNESYKRGALWIWEKPIEGVEYVLAADVSQGVLQDNCAFIVVKKNTLEEVAEFYSNSVPPNEFAMVIHRVGQWYKDALVIVEAAEQGHTVLNKLEHHLSYDNLHYEIKGGRESPGVTMNKASRPVFLDHMKTYLENGYMKIKSYRLIRELKTFIVSNRKAQAQRGKHDDLVMCLAILLGVLETGQRSMPVGAESKDYKSIDLTKGNLYLKIKAELEGGLIDQLLLEESQENEHEMMSNKEADMMGRIMSDIKRPFDALLKEFDF